MHYFLIYKKNLSYFFKIVTPVSLFSHLFTDSSPVPMLREIGSKCRVSYVCQKYNFFYIKNKQAITVQKVM